MNLSNAQSREQFVGAHAHAPTTGQDHLHVCRQVDGLGVTNHVLHVGAVDGARKVKSASTKAPCPEAVVGSHNAGPTSKPNHPTAIGTLDEFIIDQTNALVDDGA